MVVEQYDGKFPDDYQDIIKLPGVGSYTAGAILSIAFNKKIPAVDGNVMRVYSRYFNIDADISNAKSKKIFEDKVLETLPDDRRHYNQALMELGARICTTKTYNCESCPINENCEAFRLGIQDNRPIKSKKIKKKHQKMAACMIHINDKMLLMKRPPEGLLAGMWAFPVVEYFDDSDTVVRDFLDEHYGLKVFDINSTSTTKHVYTHLVWDMTLFEMKTTEQLIIDLPQTEWIALDELKNYALPKGFHKLLENRKKRVT
jgi:A/G-specific adenine glycosylase